MQQLLPPDRAPRLPRHGLEHAIRLAVHPAAKHLAVAGPADAQVGGTGPAGFVEGVGGGVGGDGAGGAVGEEGGVGGNVGYEGVEVGGVVGEDAGGGEGLGGDEGVGEVPLGLERCGGGGDVRARARVEGGGGAEGEEGGGFHSEGGGRGEVWWGRVVD